MSKVVVKSGYLFDGTQTPLQTDMLLVLEDGKVVEKAQASSLNNFLAKGYALLDFSNKFVMPGLIDAHVHLTLPGDGTAAEDYLGSTSEDAILEGARANAKASLRQGVTVLRDCGSNPRHSFPLKKEFAENKGYPLLLTSGSSLTSLKGHTHFFGGEAKDEGEVVNLVDSMAKKGADFIKLIATGGGTRGVVQHQQMLSDEQLSSASRRAHELGLYTTAHVCTTKTGWSAVDNGVDMLEHLIFADEENKLSLDWKLADRIAEKNLPVCITMSAINVSIKKYEKLNRVLEEKERAEYEMLSRFRDTIYEGFAKTKDSIRYIPGTDAGWRFSAFGSLLACMEGMAECGLSLLDTLYSATGLAAEVLRLPNKGTLEKGKDADFIVLDKNPLEALENLSNVSATYIKGECAWRRA